MSSLSRCFLKCSFMKWIDPYVYTNLRLTFLLSPTSVHLRLFQCIKHFSHMRICICILGFRSTSFSQRLRFIRTETILWYGSSQFLLIKASRLRTSIDPLHFYIEVTFRTICVIMPTKHATKPTTVFIVWSFTVEPFSRRTYIIQYVRSTLHFEWLSG